MEALGTLKSCVSQFIFEREIEKGYYAVNIQGDQPFYVSSFSMFDGFFTESDLTITSIIGNIKPIEKYNVSGITENRYRFANLHAEVFQYRVRAEKDGAFSQWTEYDMIKLDDSNGITNNSLNNNTIPRIYNTNGIAVKNTSKRGLYILDYDTQKKKIFKRYD